MKGGRKQHISHTPCRGCRRPTLLCYALPHHYNNGLIGSGVDDRTTLLYNSFPWPLDRPANNRFSGKEAKGCKGAS